MASQSKIVAAGWVRFGNDLPLALIAGPCALESRSHAHETASALKQIAERLGIGLVYKSSFDKANRTSADAGHGARRRAPALCRDPLEPGPGEPHRRARGRAMSPRRRGGRHPADPSLPLPLCFCDRISLGQFKISRIAVCAGA